MRRPSIVCRDVNFVVLDDRPLLQEEGGNLLISHFVHTHPLIGIDDAAVRKASGIVGTRRMARLLPVSFRPPPVRHFSIDLSAQLSLSSLGILFVPACLLFQQS